eukprot:CAMPEP_0173383008 /NCGR_PEP_ID=MMETSP1356-20130122/5520_1 /TAXON_ID=77927 ORGANISM="Hemiselmis virescens, Strain PCC157" /NCGR_SAMPLE_ID=MMETSP1356 /ASSEMBLY_ACC=CAM_ASM_000847 /LENGTH=101 /DNA_ID=CAMNT_0014337645 /DNA_START=72 /DNA_END=377 /DNA_ORIENTATION=-
MTGAMAARAVGAAPSAMRAMSTDGMKGFDNRERAAETLWFNKREEKVLRDLLQKMKAQADTHDAANAPAVVAAETAALKKVLPNATAAEVAKLLDWKHTSF